MAKTTIDERVLRRAIDAVHMFINNEIKVIDLTKPCVLHSHMGKYCMTHVVSLPDNTDKLFVLCHYGDQPDKAGSELGKCLMAYFGFMPEMPSYVRGTATNGKKTIPVIGFFVAHTRECSPEVNKEEHEPYPNVQALPN